MLELLVSDRIYRPFRKDIDSLGPDLVACVINGDSITPDPVEPRVLLYTADIPGEQLASMLTRYPSIEWIQVGMAGVETLLPHLGGYRGTVTNMTGWHADAVGEWVLGMVLAHARKLASVFRNSQEGLWKREVGEEISGKTLGIVGAGWIGNSVATRAAAFGMDVIGIRRSPGALPHFSNVDGPGGLPELLERSHYVLISVPLTAHTRGMIDGRAFELMRNDAVLINVARGSVVNTEDLMKALARNAIAGAILDVTDPEPLPEHHPLWSMPNVIIGAHSAWLSVRSEGRIMSSFGENFRRWAAGKPMRNVVDSKREY